MSTAAATDLCTCGHEKVNGVCLNVDCSAAQAAATTDAVRVTAKVAVKGAKAGTRTVAVKQPEPRSFNIRGNVD